MTTKPNAWNNIHNNQIPSTWNITDRNSCLELWQEKHYLSDEWQEKKQLPNDWNADRSSTPSEWHPTSQMPSGWNSGFNIPNNWGTTSFSINRSVSSGADSASLNVGKIARSGAALLSNTIGKIGNTAKNVADGAVEYAKSDAVKEKLNAAKSGVKNTSETIASAFGNAKDKITDLASRKADNSVEVHTEELSAENQEDLYEALPYSEQQHTEVSFENQDLNLISETDFSDNDAEDASVDFSDDSLSYADTASIEPVYQQEPKENYSEDSHEKEDSSPYQEDAFPQPAYQQQQQNISANPHGKEDSSPYQRNAFPQPAYHQQQQNISANPHGNGYYSQYQSNATPQPAYQQQPNYQFDNNYGNYPQYVIQSEKSSAFPVIIGISFGLIAAAALFFGIKYFDSQKESVDNPPAEIVAETTSIVTESVTEIVTTITEAQTEAVTEAQTEAVTEAVTATTEKYATEKQKIRDSVDNEVYSGRNSHIENLPDDMTLYDLHGALSTIEVKNVTLLEGAADNCRAAVSITGKEKMEILGENADWYYLVHYVGTGKFSHPEYGFIRKTTAKNSGTDPNEYTDKSNLIAVGYVNTQETSLNMRETPSTSAAITTQIPKGDYVGILYNQDGWMYVKYYKNTSSPIYYGYVSSSYITVTESYQKSGSSAVSCNKYGTIDAHSGVVSGYSSSYVLYGGAVATVRQSLGDGWHIQAVRVYSSGGITWYELYDYQDNDYYGWVDSAFIDFY